MGKTKKQTPVIGYRTRCSDCRSTSGNKRLCFMCKGKFRCYEHMAVLDPKATLQARASRARLDRRRKENKDQRCTLEELALKAINKMTEDVRSGLIDPSSSKPLAPSKPISPSTPI